MKPKEFLVAKSGEKSLVIKGNGQSIFMFLGSSEETSAEPGTKLLHEIT